VELVMQAVQRVIGELAERDRVVAVVKGALAVVRNQKQVTLRVAPPQLPLVQAALNELLAAYPGIGYLDVVADARLEADACILDSEIGIVEASCRRAAAIGGAARARQQGMKLQVSRMMALALPDTPPSASGPRHGSPVIKAVADGEKSVVCNPGGPEMKAEVVGFQRDAALLTPIGDMIGLSAATEVTPTGRAHMVAVGPGLLGRVLDGLGRPMDADTRGALEADAYYPVFANAPDPLKRRIIDRPMELGVRALDGLLTCGEGQRMGIFAAAGGGKSTLLSMLVKGAAVDVTVIALSVRRPQVRGSSSTSSASRGGGAADRAPPATSRACSAPPRGRPSPSTSSRPGQEGVVPDGLGDALRTRSAPMDGRNRRAAVTHRPCSRRFRS
jgi:hypothetical protein